MKVAEHRRGSKAGELLVNFAIREAIQHGLEEIYLTHRIRDNDYLVRLIAQYGFSRESALEDGESVFVKRITPGPGDDPGPFEASVRFYPSFYDGEMVNKFLIPVEPRWHNRLFTGYEKRQPGIHEFGGQFSSEGNSIKKAYLSHSPIRKIEQGDVLLFYRSHDHQEITSLGVCEHIRYDVNDPEEIKRTVGRVSVFTDREIREHAQKPTTVIRFKWHFDLNDPLHYQVLLDDGILNGSLQSIQEVDETEYKYIRSEGGIDERFTIN
jgi:predicted RNA-binding protein with PUA-like domain